VGSSDGPKIEADGGSVGQPQDPAGESIATRRLVLGYIPSLNERPEEARHGRLVEAHLLADGGGPEPVLVRTRQRLQDVDPTTQGPCHKWFTQ
jgi:hypothetical protein